MLQIQRIIAVVFSLLLLIVAAVPTRAQDVLQQAPAVGGMTPLKVATRVIPPFVVQDGDKYGGFSAELWEALSREIGRPAYEWRVRKNINEILGSVESKEVDVAIAAISITEARELKFDFSLPMFESGLQIMVPRKSNGPSGFIEFLQSGFRQLANFLTSEALKFVLAMLSILIIVAGHLAWYLERGHPTSDQINDNYFPGIFEGMAWAAGAFVGQQSNHLQTVFGRVMSIFAIICSVILLTYVQAILSSNMTVERLQGGIQGPEDLPGRKVGTTVGSTTATWLKERQIRPLEFQKISDAIEALDKEQVDAVVFDAPVLLFHVATEGAARHEMVGPIFRKESYGILFPQGSPLRKPVNTALLKLRENGTYDKLYAKWFGNRK